MSDTYAAAFNGEQIAVTVQFTANTYSRPAMINDQRAIDATLSTNNDSVPDITNPTAPDQMFRTAKSLDYTITGSGMIDSVDLANWTNWFTSTQPLPIKAYVPVGNAGTDAVIYSGNFLLTKFTLTGKPHSKATASLTMEPSGPVSIAVMANSYVGGVAALSFTL